MSSSHFQEQHWRRPFYSGRRGRKRRVVCPSLQSAPTVGSTTLGGTADYGHRGGSGHEPRVGVLFPTTSQQWPLVIMEQRLRTADSTNFLCFSPFGSFLRSNDVNLKSSLNFSNMFHRHRYLMPPLTRWSCWWINFQCDKDCFLVNGPKMALTTLRPKGIDLVSIYLKWTPSIHIWTSILGTGAQEGLEKL